MRLSHNGVTVIADEVSVGHKVIMVDDDTDETSVFYDNILYKFVIGFDIPEKTGKE